MVDGVIHCPFLFITKEWNATRKVCGLQATLHESHVKISRYGFLAALKSHLLHLLRQDLLLQALVWLSGQVLRYSYEQHDVGHTLLLSQDMRRDRMVGLNCPLQSKNSTRVPLQEFCNALLAGLHAITEKNAIRSFQLSRFRIDLYLDRFTYHS